MLRNVGLRKSVEQPVLDLNFAASQIGSNGAPDSRIDFSRGNNAWFVDSDGLVKKSPHNLLLQSEDFSTTWSPTRSNVTTDATTSPIGTLTADKLYLDSTSSTSHFAIQNVSIGAGQKHTFSVYLKADDLTHAHVSLINNTSPYESIRIGIDLSDGSTGSLVVGNGATDGSFSVTDAGNGWYRVAVSGIIGSSATAWGVVYLAESTSTFIVATGDGSSGIFVWGAQLSQHTTLPVDNPYIKTEGSAAYAARLDHDPSWFMSAAQEQNLLETTDLDDGTYYGLGRSTIAEQSSVENPFGGTDGVYLHLESAVGGSSYIYAFSATNWQQYLTEGKQYTLSIYAKQFSGQKLELRSPNNDFRNARFNVDTGVIEEQDSLLDDATIEDVGNGWFRCSITDTIATFSPTTWILAYLYNDLASPDYGLYYYGAQLEVGSTASIYHRTEGAPYYGEGATPKGLLIEEARTNLVDDSEDFSAASWSGSGVTVTGDDVLAPDGTTTGTKLVATSTNAILSDSFTKAASAKTYTATLFAKTGDEQNITLTIDDGNSTNRGRVVFDITDGSVSSTNDDGDFTNTSGSVEDFGNGWYRLRVTTTTNTGTSLRHRFFFTDFGTDTCFVWGAQLEEGSFPTSYIQTTGSTATRNADVAVMGPTTGGTELVTNGTFDTDTSGWTLSSSAGVTASISSSGATLTCSTATGSALLYQDTQRTPTVIGRRYRASADFTVNSGDGVNLVAYSGSFSGGLGSANITSGSSTVSFDFTATTTSTQIAISRRSTFADTDEYVVDNISVRELYPFEQYRPDQGTMVVAFDTQETNSRGPWWFSRGGASSTGWGLRLQSTTTIDSMVRDSSNFNTMANPTITPAFDIVAASYEQRASDTFCSVATADSFADDGHVNDIDVSVDTLDIGNCLIGGSNTGIMSGHIKRLQYFPIAMNDETKLKNMCDD